MIAIKRPSTGLRRRPGQALLEFSIVALILYLILAAIFTYGRALFVAETLQHTADLFAHELARTPLPPNDTLDQALQDPQVTTNLYDPTYLLINIQPWLSNAAIQPTEPGGQVTYTQTTYPTIDSYLQSIGVPLINRMLAPVMILDTQPDQNTYLWYPGAIQDPSSKVWYVSVINSSDPINGTPTTRPVIEAVSNPDTFSLGNAPTSGTVATPSGLVGLRINYPYQSSTMTAYTYSVNGVPVPSTFGQAGPVYQQPVTIGPDESTSPGLYSGTDNLGQLYSGNYIVRPFQKMISAQAVYRREIFGLPSSN